MNQLKIAFRALNVAFSIKHFKKVFIFKYSYSNLKSIFAIAIATLLKDYEVNNIFHNYPPSWMNSA